MTVAGRGQEIEEPYPTRAVDVVIEILSKEEPMPHLLEKCQAYAAWGFEYVYVVNPEGKQLFRWTGSALELTDSLTVFPATRIWQWLEENLRRRS
jgi:Uma2 family endonuclease